MRLSLVVYKLCFILPFIVQIQRHQETMGTRTHELKTVGIIETCRNWVKTFRRLSYWGPGPDPRVIVNRVHLLITFYHRNALK